MFTQLVEHVGKRLDHAAIRRLAVAGDSARETSTLSLETVGCQEPMPKKRTKDLAAKDLKPGLRFRYQGADVEILRERESDQDRFGQGLDRWWSRNLGTGQEGYVSLGPPKGKLYKVELLSGASGASASPAKSRHHATKKSPAQLDREIAEALGDSQSGMTPEQIDRYRSGRTWGWPADLSFKAATGRPLSRTPGRRSHATTTKITKAPRKHTISSKSDKEYRCSCGAGFRSEREAERHDEWARDRGDVVEWRV
jgi:hypothetical protein